MVEPLAGTQPRPAHRRYRRSPTSMLLLVPVPPFTATGRRTHRALLDRGYDVPILNRGVHEPDDLPEVRHIHGDPFKGLNGQRYTGD